MFLIKHYKLFAKKNTREHCARDMTSQKGRTIERDYMQYKHLNTVGFYLNLTMTKGTAQPRNVYHIDFNITQI